MPVVYSSTRREVRAPSRPDHIFGAAGGSAAARHRLGAGVAPGAAGRRDVAVAVRPGAGADDADPARHQRARRTWRGSDSGARSSSAPCTRAWVRSESPKSSMKPRAAAWSKVSSWRS